jgi:hypothetical protein
MVLSACTGILFSLDSTGLQGRKAVGVPRALIDLPLPRYWLGLPIVSFFLATALSPTLPSHVMSFRTVFRAVTSIVAFWMWTGSLLGGTAMVKRETRAWTGGIAHNARTGQHTT